LTPSPRLNFTVDCPSFTPIDLSPFDARALSVATLAADNNQTLSPNARVLARPSSRAMTATRFTID
jgi:regulator of sirC expression with transglutaminase-like and TPR domain